MSMIWKYELQITDEQTILMPGQAKILSAANQNGKLCIWAMVDTEQPIAPKYFSVIGTGHPLSEDFPLRKFIDTVIIGQFVWHVFEVL
jgi:hypothetical protein